MAFVLAKTAFLALGLNYGVHYTSARLYDKFCLPHSFEDILQSLATTASPACSLLLNTMVGTQNNYATAISASFVSVVSSVLKTFS